MKRFRKLLAAAGKLAGVCLLFVLAIIAEENVRGYLRLRQELNPPRARGEPLTLTELHLSPVPGEGNAAPALERAVKELAALTRQNPVAGEGPHGLMRLTSPGCAAVSYRAPDYPAAHAVGQRGKDGKAPTYGWPQLERELAIGAAPLTQVREALRQPVAVPTVDYTKTASANSDVWKSYAWLSSSALDALHRGDHDAAAANIAAMFALGSFLGHDLHAVAQMIASTSDAFALALVWEALQDEGWTDAQLGVLQAALSQEHPPENTLRCLEYGRVETRTYFDQLRQSNDGRLILLRLEGHNIMNDILGDKEPEYPSAWLTQVRSTLWRLLWADQDEARALELWQTLLAEARVFLREQSWSAFAARYPKESAAPHGLAFCRGEFAESMHPRLVYRPLLESFARMQTQRRMALAAVALKRHELNTGHLPPGLTALVPGLLPSVPVDLMDGQPLRYRPAADGKAFLLYSVGMDGHDDGGDPAPMAGKDVRASIWSGRDAVWPVATTALAASPAASP